jgi:hypothetical protein
MIDFILDFSQDLIVAILNNQISDDNKNKCIRAYIDLYDSIKNLEFQSEKFLIGFKEYINASDRKQFDLSKLRILIRSFI